jgi:hypothetical protein
MMRFAAGTFLFVTVALTAPAVGSAQAPGAPLELPPEAREWIAEIEQIHVQLAQLQERALQDPDLAARQDSLGNHIKVTMEAIDPSLAQNLGRIEEMERQAAEAEARDDEAKLAELREEARQIEQRFVAAQRQALQRPDLAAEFSAFQTLLQERMLQTDPDAPRLLARFQELERKLTQLGVQGS